MSRTSAAVQQRQERSERRAEPRKRIVLRVGLLSDGARATFCLVKNVSPHGVQLKLYGQVTVGSAVNLRIGDEEPIEGHIAWVRDGLAGMEFPSPLDPVGLLRMAQKLPATKRRSSPRVGAIAQVVIRTGGKVYPAELCDISTSGAKVRTRQSPQLGPSVMLSVPNLPTMRAFVRWADETELGLVFDAPLPIQLIAEWVNDRVRVSG